MNGTGIAATLQSITVTPATPAIPLGTTLQFLATGSYNNTTGNLTSTVVWQTAAPAIATFPSTLPKGTASTVAQGTTTVSAAVGSIKGTTSLTVAAPALVSIAVTPGSASVVAGLSQPFTATGTFSNRTTQNITGTVNWSSSNPAAAAVNATGLATGIAQGLAVIQAASGAITGTANLTVTPPQLVSISVTAVNSTIPLGASAQLKATGTYTDSSTQDLTATALWSSSNPAIASVNSAGLASAGSQGTASIRAASGAINGALAVTVGPPALASLAITPANATVALGSSRQLTATGTFTDASTKDLSSSVTWNSSAVATATVSATGLAASVAQGTVTIQISQGAISSSTGLTVGPPALVSIAVTPAAASVPLGTAQQFTATGTFTDSSTQNLTQSVTWSSSNPATAAISNTGLATTNGLAQGTATILAAQGAVSGSTTLTVGAPALVSISVTPANPSIALGTNVQLTATGLFTDGGTLNLTASATWSSASPAVTVSNTAGSQGVASSASLGTADISAQSGAITGSTRITVTPATLVSLSITPAAASISLGTAQQFTATGTFTDNSQQDVTNSVTWNSSAGSVASINASTPNAGLATSVAQGTTVITAALGSVSNTSSLTVTAAALVSIAVTPGASSNAAGTMQQFIATGTFTDGSTQNLTTTAAWASSSGAAATVSNAAGSQGLATAVAVGASSISATINAVVGSAAMTVTPATVVSIVVNPAAISTPLGAKQQFTASGTFTDGSTQDITASVHWSSGAGLIATISNSQPTAGLASTVAQGVVMITAVSGAASGTAALTVTPAALVSIAVTPATPSIALGSTQQFTATGTFTDSSTQDVTLLVTWNSATPATATISNTAGSVGLASSISVGTSTITASSGAVSSGPVALTVTAAAVVSIAVTPSVSSISIGQTKQFTATGTYTDSTTQDVTTQVHWSSSNGGVATISDSAPTQGLASPVAPGSVTIIATLGTVTGTANLTISPATLVSIALTPAFPFVGQGSIQQFNASGTYSDNSVSDITSSATWASSDISVASVDSAGLASAGGAGATTITAAMNSVSASTTLTSIAGGFVSCSSRPIDMNVLVITAGRTEADFPAITQALGNLGVPYTVFDMNATPVLSAAQLSSNCHGFFQGVILASGGYIYGFSGGGAQNLADYERVFGIRQLNWYTYPDTNFGLNNGPTPLDTTATPLNVTYTAAAQTVFSYANAANPLTISNAFSYLSHPLGNATPLLVDASGNALAVLFTQFDGRQYLTLTFDSNQFLSHDLVLSYGLVNWVTQGLFLGERRTYMSPQVDDMFIDGADWLASTPCGTPVDNTGFIFRLGQPDLQAYIAWQQSKQAQPGTAGFQTTFAFNGSGAVAGTYVPDTLTPYAQANQGLFQWVNHTFDHTDLNTISYGDAVLEITKNNQTAVTLGLTNFSTQNMVTPGITGLTNPNFLQAAHDNGITNLVSDTSYPNYNNPTFNTGIVNPIQSSILMLPRHPNNLYYNVSVPDGWVKEYNCFYSTNLLYSDIIDRESQILLGYLLRGDLDALQFHQSNLRAYDGVHSLLGDLLDATFTKFGALTNLPIASPAMTSVAQKLAARAQYNAANVTATMIPHHSITITAQQAAVVPVTGLNLPGATLYGGQPVSSISLTAGQSVTFPLP